MNPKVSIVVPVYNVEGYLDICLDSLVKQTLEDIEIIIVDDGSTDQSAFIAQKYVEKHNNIYLYLKDNEGPGEARNYGMKFTKGKYVTFVDSDDALTPDACEKLYKIAVEHNCDIVTGKSVWRRSNGELEPVEYYEKWFKRDLQKNFKEDLSYGSEYVIPTGKLFLNSLISNHNILFPNIIGEDVPFAFYTFYFANTIKLIDEIVYLRTERHDYTNKSITQQYSAKTIIDRIEGNRLIDEFCESYSWKGMWKFYIPQLKAINKLLLQIKEPVEREKAYQAFKSYIIQLSEEKMQLAMEQLCLEKSAFKEMEVTEYIFKQELKHEYVYKKDWEDLRKWSVELEIAKEWLEQQLRSYQEEVVKQRDIIIDLTHWTKELEQSKTWLEQQLKNYNQ